MLAKEEIYRMSFTERMEAMELLWESFSKEGMDSRLPIGTERFWRSDPQSSIPKRPHGSRWMSFKPVDGPMKKHIVVLSQAASDIERGIDFYNRMEKGVGDYFRDSISRHPPPRNLFRPAPGSSRLLPRPIIQISLRHLLP